MQREIGSITKNNTWELCDLPPHIDPNDVVGCRWIYRLKEVENGQPGRYKARLVAKGYSQIKGVNHDETYSPVLSFTSLRALFAHAAQQGLDIFHIDIETAFLHADLSDEVYMCQPEGFVSSDQKGKVCRLKEPLYGLKQGSREWNKKLKNKLVNDIKMKQLIYDNCIYYISEGDKVMFVATWVDEILFFTNCPDFFNMVKNKLSESFPVKFHGEVKRFLGINVHRHKSKGIIQLEQSDYIRTVLKNYGMEDCNPVASPMETGTIFHANMSSDENPQTDIKLNVPYQSAIDLAYSISTLSKFNNCYQSKHWTAVNKRVLRYLKGTYFN